MELYSSSESESDGNGFTNHLSQKPVNFTKASDLFSKKLSSQILAESISTLNHNNVFSSIDHSGSSDNMVDLS